MYSKPSQEPGILINSSSYSEIWVRTKLPTPSPTPPNTILLHPKQSAIKARTLEVKSVTIPSLTTKARGRGNKAGSCACHPETKLMGRSISCLIHLTDYIQVFADPSSLKLKITCFVKCWLHSCFTTQRKAEEKDTVIAQGEVSQTN